jgi:hypothetical protein
MPFQGDQYPSHWPELAQAAKAAASWRCAESGALHGSLAVSERNRTIGPHLPRVLSTTSPPIHLHGWPSTAKPVTCATMSSNAGARAGGMKASD